MARVSFTLRSNTGASGSYLRYADTFGVRPNEDSALRQDGLNLSPVVATESSFSATADTYGSARLEWQVPLSTPTSTPTPTSVLLVYSPNGVPQTIQSGTILVDSDTTTSYNHTGLREGAWAYYALFIHYTTSPSVDDYYERAAELEILIPKDYGSTLTLWDNLPQYVRLEDIARGDFDFDPAIGQTHGDAVGPLFKFLSIVGFDMDRIRTLIDYIMVSKDPEMSDSEVLDAVADMMGIDVDVANLGDVRLRAILNDIGTYRRSKGTATALALFTKALTGSDLTLNQTTHKLTLYSHRVNYITVPKTGTGITSWRVAHLNEITTPQNFSPNPYSGASTNVTLSGQTWTLVPNANNIIGARIRLSSTVPVKLGDFVEFSVHSSTPANRILWARIVDASNNVLGWGQVVSTISGVSYVEIDITGSPANTTTFTNGTLEFMVDLRNGTFVGQNYLVERNFLGDYFDGDTVRGGWLVGSPSISDFRWSGSANASASIYAEDYRRTVGVMADAFTDLLPITEESKYSVLAYNAVPGL